MEERLRGRTGTCGVCGGPLIIDDRVADTAAQDSPSTSSKDQRAMNESLDLANKHLKSIEHLLRSVHALLVIALVIVPLLAVALVFFNR